jgi:hypothetical protein
MAEKEYQRLPGRGIRRQGAAGLVSARRSRLWLGRDHLLLVESQWYTQEYKRFYFRDIQSIIIRRTNTGRIISLTLMIFAFIWLFGVIAATDGWRIFWIILLSIFGFFLSLNTLLGPTSVCHLRTAVQTEELPSVNRLRRARRVLGRLRPLITEAQGPLPPEEFARMAEPPVAQAFGTGPIETPPVIGAPEHSSPPPQT